MVSIVDLYEKLSQVQSMKIATNISGKGYEIPFIALDPSGAFFVLDEGNISGKEKEVRNIISPIQDALSLTAHKMFIYSYDDEGWTFLNQYTDEVEQVDNVVEHIMEQVNSGVYYIDENRLDYMYSKLSFSTKGGENIREMPDGQVYVKKNGHWFPATDEDSDYVFRQTCLFGVFGWFQSHKGKKMTAFIYAITCGLFGIGWIFDALAFLVGGARDADGYYYLPLSDKKKSWLMFLGVLVGAFVALFLYKTVLTLAASALGGLFSRISPNDLESVARELG